MTATRREVAEKMTAPYLARARTLLKQGVPLEKAAGTLAQMVSPDLDDLDSVAASIAAAQFAALTAMEEVHGSFTFDDAMEAKEINAIAQAMNDASSVAITWQFRRHDEAGRRVFTVSEGLAAQLRDTEVRGLLCRDVRLPYESICVQIPRSAGVTVDTDVATRVMEEVYVTRDAGNWRVLAMGDGDPGRLFSGDTTLLLNLPIEKTPDAKLDDLLDAVNEHDSWPGASSGVSGWRGVFRFLLNVVLYATWPDAEREHVMLNAEARDLWAKIHREPRGSSKKRRLLDRFGELDPRRRVVLGKSVVVDRSTESTGGGPGVGRPLAVRTRVSGHWRQQPCGRGRAERKLIWIEPFWRGPEDGPLGPAVHHLTRPAAKTEGR